MQSYVNGRALRHWFITVVSLEIAAAVAGSPDPVFALIPLAVTALIFGVRALGDAWASGVVLRQVTATSDYELAAAEFNHRRLNEIGLNGLSETLDPAGQAAVDLVIDALKRRDHPTDEPHVGEVSN